MEMVTHRDAQIVIHRPALTMSPMEKYPVPYGMTLVGVDVTRMKASEAVMPAGMASSSLYYLGLAFDSPQ